jgi:hypothetical protein
MNDTHTGSEDLPIAYFITPHGFGHAARAAAVMLALLETNPRFHFHIYTKVPVWFFRESGLSALTYHPVLTDIGLVQQDAMQEDIPATIESLSEFYPINPAIVTRLADEIRYLGCLAVLCDIAPLGIAVAEKSALPSILLENFTWDWIYQSYIDEYPALKKYITLLKDQFVRVDYHIQTQPACLPSANSLSVHPVSRPIRTDRQEVRKRLSLHADNSVGLVTLGGIQGAQYNLERLKNCRDTIFIIPDASRNVLRDGNLILLPHHHGIYHPDLVNACDFVIGKLGYSTFAECYSAGVAYGFIPRARFPESPPLADFVLKNISSVLITELQYGDGSWLEVIPELLNTSRETKERKNGSYQVAAFINSLLFPDM